MTELKSVDRLKELLFDRESREIGTLAQRLDSLGASEQKGRTELSQRIDALAERTGGDAQLRRSIARVLDGAILDAEEHKHQELTQALAPMVRRTFRAELRSEATQEALTSTLYPKLGDMVRRYIASAMRDMMDSINRRLESGLTENRLMLKIRSILTGRPMAELALAATQRFRVEELYLIRRGSGELVHRWSREPAAADARAGDNRDTLISGFLTAITAFAEEAFASERSSLRALELDDHRIYLRASPAHLLAAKCSGKAEAAVEQVLDASLIEILGSHQDVEAHNPSDGGETAREQASRAHQSILTDAANTLETRIGDAASEARQSRGSFRTLKILLLLFALPLAAYAAWQSYIGYVTGQLQAAVDGAVGSVPEVKGYPLKARVERGGRSIWLSGLAPDTAARDKLTARLHEIAPDAELAGTIGVLPVTDVTAAIADQVERRALERVRRRLEHLAADLRRRSNAMPESPARAAIAASASTADQTARDLLRPAAARDGASVASRLDTGLQRLTEANEHLIALAGSQPPSAQAPASAPADPATNLDRLEEISLAAERIGASAALVEHVGAQARAIVPLEQQAGALAGELAALRARVEGLKSAPTPREALEDFVKSNAIFFANATDYRDGPAAEAVLAAVHRLAVPVGGLLRVVGYTDEVGIAARNQTLSQQRAEKVVDDLVARGFPRNRLVAIGRATTMDLAPRTGATSANRRVEFEIGFNGEEASTP